MTGIYWSEGEATVKSFSSSSRGSAKGTETVLKIEIAVTDHSALGFMLEKLTEITRAQALKEKPAKSAKQLSKRALALAAPLLRIPDLREDRR